MSNQKQSAFWNLNYALGVASFVAFCLGTVGFYSALSLGGLRAVGVKAPVSDENVWKFGASSYFTIIASAGVGSIAVAAAYIGGTIAAKKEYRQKLVEDSYRQNKAPYTPPITNEEETIKDDWWKQVKVYHLFKNEQIGPGGKLLILGDVHRTSAFIGEATDKQIDALIERFDCCSDEELVGKAFTSYDFSASDALDEYLSRQSKFIDCLYKGFDLEDIEYCSGCIHMNPNNGTVCPMHPEGWCAEAWCLQDNCPDKQIAADYPMAPYENESIIRDLNKRIHPHDASLCKYDDGGVFLFDYITNRQFRFDWFGKLELLSDRIEDLPGNIDAYVQYYEKRDVAVLIDYSVCVDDFGKKLKGVGTVAVLGHQRDIHVTLYQNKYCGIEFAKSEFNRYGYPLYPYKRLTPLQLKPTFSEYIQHIISINSNDSIQRA